MKDTFYSFFQSKVATNKKLIAILIDPDKFDFEGFKSQHNLLDETADLILVGGSILTTGNIEETITQLKEVTNKPVFIFPGNSIQLSKNADGVFLLSLISGRNADFLIGQHVLAAPLLKKSNIEIIATGYILVDGGESTSVSYISNTTPIPFNKPEIAVCTAMAGEFLGLKQIYLEAGSGALVGVNTEMIKAVKSAINIPLIVGGGLNSIDKINIAFTAGADIVVIGTVLENNLKFLAELSNYKKTLIKQL
ncbi:MAG: geranylgeranylglyceryl/heptaprenylglyceryl phosphate synthase [Bacteroidota bacterium]